jgi:hypothetical protein
MLSIAIIVLLGGAILATSGVVIYRRRHAVPPVIDPDDEYAGDAPLLIMPRVRNTIDARMPQTAVRPPVAAPAPAAPARRPGRSYVAPLSGVGADEIVQLWPGRLVPLSGADEEIRFIRKPGVSRFTFGRSPGPADSHIQLLAATASRMHAYMEPDNGRWRIGNMSETNQVLINGEALESGDAARWLSDGDRIELGEVGFIFRER